MRKKFEDLSAHVYSLANVQTLKNISVFDKNSENSNIYDLTN